MGCRGRDPGKSPENPIGEGLSSADEFLDFSVIPFTNSRSILQIAMAISGVFVFFKHVSFSQLGKEPPGP